MTRRVRMLNCLNLLEESSNLSTSAVQAKITNKTSSVAVYSVKSQMQYSIMAMLSFSYGDHCTSCFLIVFPCIGLK